MLDDPRHPCPCCGYLVLDAKPPGTWLACPICAWTDAGDEEVVNSVSRRQAQINFMKHGAILPDLVEVVRPPGLDDQRLSAWKSLAERGEELKGEVLAAIEEAFGHLRHDGWRLYEAELEDNYGSESAITRTRAVDDYTRWQDIPEEGIAQCTMVLCYFEPVALRFHLPAFMTWALKNLKTSDSLSGDATIYALERSKLGPHTDSPEDPMALLDDAQRTAVALFLRFMAEHSEGYADEDAARRALDQYWHRYEP